MDDDDPYKPLPKETKYTDSEYTQKFFYDKMKNLTRRIADIRRKMIEGYVSYTLKLSLIDQK